MKNVIVYNVQMLACWENCLVCVGWWERKLKDGKIWGRENRNNSYGGSEIATYDA